MKRKQQTKQAPASEQAGEKKQKQRAPAGKKMSEYGKQLHEKQRVKRMYGLREKQFRRFFDKGVRLEGAPGENLLSLLERRLDNVLYRLKLAVTRTQARQVVVHGHVLVNGKGVRTPSFIVSLGDVVSLKPVTLEKKAFLDQVIDKRLKVGIKVPEWLELDKADRRGRVLRTPVRTDIQVPVEEHLIVELYSK